MQQTARVETTDSAWRSLYRIAAVAVLISVVLIPLSMVAYFLWPPFPEDVLAVIQENRLAGLMSLDFMYLASSLVAIPLFPALYATLRRVNHGLAALALAMGLVGLVCLVPARPILEMFTISDQYAAATTDAQRAIYLAAGEAISSMFYGTAYNVHYILGSASMLISSFLMLRSSVFGRGTAYVGIATNIVVFGLYVPIIGVYLSLLSVLGYFVWYILLARRFFRLGWGVS